MKRGDSCGRCYECRLAGHRTEDPDDSLADLAERAEGIRRVGTFEERGMLGGGAGLVVDLASGRELQVSVVRGR